MAAQSSTTRPTAVNHRRYAAAGLALAALALSQLTFTDSASALPGYQRMITSGALSSLDKTQISTCPVGTKVIGGGGALTGGLGRVVIETLVPLANGTGFAVTARETVPYAGAWSLTTTAICAPAPTGLEYLSYTGPAGSAKYRWTGVQCPAGKSILGIGGGLVGGLGQVSTQGLRVQPDFRSARFGAIEREGGPTTNWSVNTRAICVNTPVGLTSATATTAKNSLASKTAVATCPAGTLVHGAGADLTSSDGQVLLGAVTALSNTAVTVTAAEDANGYAGAWSATAYAICAP